MQACQRAPICASIKAGSGSAASGRNAACSRASRASTASSSGFAPFSACLCANEARRPEIPPRAPPRGRAPRSKRFSSCRVSAIWPPRACPKCTSGCLSTARVSTGAKPPAWQASTRRSKLASGRLAKGTPALSSTLMPQRFNSTATRRAKLRSRVTSAAVLLSCCKTLRIKTAIAPASARGSGASIKCTLSSCGFSSTLIFAAHCAVFSAGASARPSVSTRAPAARLPGHGCTSARVACICANKCANAYCGCDGLP